MQLRSAGAIGTPVRIARHLAMQAGASAARQVAQNAGRAFGSYLTTPNNRPNRNNNTPNRTPQRNRVQASRQIANRAAGSVRIGAKKGKFTRKSKRGLKVSKNLRKKIKKVIDSEESHLEGTHYMLPLIQTEKQEADHLKTWANIPLAKTNAGAGATNPGVYGEIHSWNLILDSASKLYNEKPNTQHPYINDAKNFDVRTTVIEVVYNKMEIWLKNNSNRTYHIGIHKFVSKDNNTGSNPLNLWESALINEQGSSKVMQGFNMTGVDSNRLVRTEWSDSPNMFYQMRKNYNMETVKMVLEPGQNIAQTVMLPTGEMTGADYFVKGVYQENHKGAVFLAISFIADVIQAKNTLESAGVGRAGYWVDPAPQVANQPQGGIIIETKFTRKIKMPEPTGYIVPTPVPSAGDVVKLGLRIPRIVHEDWKETFQPDTGTRVDRRVDPENPAAVLAQQ